MPNLYLYDISIHELVNLGASGFQKFNKANIFDSSGFIPQVSMKSFLTHALATLLLLWSFGARAQFEGTLELIPSGCEQIGQCTLKSALRFTDSTKVVWEARAGLPTDGASIPGIFQPFIGSPFDPKFIKAAVVHDHYCDRHVRAWRQTHKVFYEGLIEDGVSRAKAKAMYFAVFLGGPKWVKLEPGKDCGPNCVNIWR